MRSSTAFRVERGISAYESFDYLVVASISIGVPATQSLTPEGAILCRGVIGGILKLSGALRMFLAFSKHIIRIPFIDSFLGDKVILYSRRIRLDYLRGVVGWGRKDTAIKAIEFASKHRLPYLALEDGFVCSYGLRVNGFPPLSLIVDPIGIYYDAQNPSLLEEILNFYKFSREDLSIAEKAIDLILKHNISKFNYQDDISSTFFKTTDKKRVLLVDQTYNDKSVILGLANERTFYDMLKVAVDENPDAEIYIKIHPDVINKKKKGYLSEIIKDKKFSLSKNINIIREDFNPISILKNVDKVYVVSSQMGMEALLLGKKVVCLGMPFYAGWGLTEDRIECSRRRRKVSLIELFCAAYIKYCRYINPKTGKIGTIFDVIEFILRQKEWKAKINRYNFIALDFHIARRHFIRPFLEPYLSKAHNRIKFLSSEKIKKKILPENTVLLVWGGMARRNVQKEVGHRVNIWTLEDGFIRSVGLGAEFVPPMSLVFDTKGIYYDSTDLSDLEKILNSYQFTDEELQTAERLRKLIIENNITKYNVGGKRTFVKPYSSKKVILVPGQVEDDQAIIFSEGKIKTNYELILKVRERNPDAYIIYKPHPDTVSKNRKSEKFYDKIKSLVDHIEIEADIVNCLEIADEVHTITSLSGFEALIRGKQVFTYGSPFYAGWGLTIDELVFPKRTRRLSLQELIAGVLLVYPVYYDWKLKGIVDCETIINRIIEKKAEINYHIKTLLPKSIKKFLNYIKFLIKYRMY